MGKSSYDFSFFNFDRGRTFLRHFNNLRKVFRFTILSIRNMLHSCISNCSSGKYPIFIAIPRRNKTICSHKYGTIKFFKLFILFPPGITIISYKMFILLKSWIVISRQHLTMSININSSSFSLLQ